MEKPRFKNNERTNTRFKIKLSNSEQNVEVTDISTTGCHISTGNKYLIGDTLTLTFSPEGSSGVLSLSGKIVWVKCRERENLHDPDYFDYGFEFLETERLETSEIIDFILHHVE